MKKILRCLKTVIISIKCDMILCKSLAIHNNNGDLAETNYWLLYKMYSTRKLFFLFPFHIFYHLKYDKPTSIGEVIFLLLVPIWLFPLWVMYFLNIKRNKGTFYD